MCLCALVRLRDSPEWKVVGDEPRSTSQSDLPPSAAYKPEKWEIDLLERAAMLRQHVVQLKAQVLVAEAKADEWERRARGHVTKKVAHGEGKAAKDDDKENI